VSDAGLRRFWSRVALQKMILSVDINVIELILEFAQPVFPKLALLGSKQLVGCGSTLQETVVHFGAMCRNVVATDESIVACSGGRAQQVIAWNLAPEGEPRPKIYSGASAPVTSVSVNVECNYLVGGCHDGNIRIWNVNTTECIGTCAYYEWYDRCGGYGLGHRAPVIAVASGPVFNSAGTDIVSGDEYGILCAWQLESRIARLCVDVPDHLGCSNSNVTCLACMPGLVVCGLSEGLAAGYLAESGECAFMLGAPMLSPLLAVGLVQKPESGAAGATTVIGCLADGSVLHWDVTHSSRRQRPLSPKLLACSATADASVEVETARAHIQQKNGQTSIVWVACDTIADRLHVRWSEPHANGHVHMLDGFKVWQRELGPIQGLAQI